MIESMTAVCGCANLPSCSGRPVAQLQLRGAQINRPAARGKRAAQHRQRLSGPGPICRSSPRPDFKPEDQTLYQPLKHRPYSDQFYPDEELPETDEWMTVTNRNYRNGKMFEQTVGADMMDAIFDESVEEGIVLDDMKYWFTKPPGGWSTGHRQVLKAKQIAASEANAKHFGDGRTNTLDIIMGSEITGTITKLMLHHGALVDIGAQHDALLPCRFDNWSPDVVQTLEIFSEIRIRIHKIVHSPICRFPLIAEIAQPEIRVLLPDVQDYEPCFDLRGGWDFNQTRALTGRDLRVKELYEHRTEREVYMERQIWQKNESDEDLHARYTSPTFENPILNDQLADMAASM